MMQEEELELDENEFFVERILERKLIQGKPKYLIRWAGFDSDEDTWEDEENLYCEDLLRKFKESLENVKKPKKNSKPKKSVDMSPKARLRKTFEKATFGSDGTESEDIPMDADQFDLSDLVIDEGNDVLDDDGSDYSDFSSKKRKFKPKEKIDPRPKRRKTSHKSDTKDTSVGKNKKKKENVEEKKLEESEDELENFEVTNITYTRPRSSRLKAKEQIELEKKDETEEEEEPVKRIRTRSTRAGKKDEEEEQERRVVVQTKRKSPRKRVAKKSTKELENITLDDIPLECEKCSSLFQREDLSSELLEYADQTEEWLCKSCFPTCAICDTNDVKSFVKCERCTVVYHVNCLNPKKIKNYRECKDCKKWPEEIESILTFRIVKKNDKEDINCYVKWKGKSYRECAWVNGSWVRRIAPKKYTKVDFTKTPLSVTDVVPEEWITQEKVITHVQKGRKKNSKSECSYLVKWRNLPYDQATWLTEDGIEKELIKDYFRHKERQKEKKKQNPVNRKIEKYEKFKFNESPIFLKGKLFDFQLEGLNWLLFSWWNKRNAILGDEMGLGKSIQTIAFISTLNQLGVKHPALLVVPLSTILNWVNEFHKWAPDLKVINYTGNSESRNIIQFHELSPPNTFDVLLTSYEIAMAARSTLKKFTFGVLVVDEGHRLKNQKSKLYTILEKMNVKFRILLTGTPLQNNTGELFALLSFLKPSEPEFQSEEAFEKAFGNIKDSDQVNRLHHILKPHLLRRVKEAVLNLPNKAEIAIPCPLSELQKLYYKSILLKSYPSLSNKKEKKKAVINVLAALRNVCNHPYIVPTSESITPNMNEDEIMNNLIQASGKLLLLDKMLTSFAKNKNRLLIFSQMTRMLDILEDYVNWRGFSYERLDGNVSLTNRQSSIDRFNSPNGAFIFLISTKAGGLGLNLAVADTIIIYDSDFNPQNDLQAISRAHRIGQKNPVLIYRLFSENSVEEVILERARDKLLLEHLIVEKIDAKLKSSEVADILKLGALKLFSSEQTNDSLQNSKNYAFNEEKLALLLDREKCFESVKQQSASLIIKDKSGVVVDDVWKINETALDPNSENFWETLLHKSLEEENSKAAADILIAPANEEDDLADTAGASTRKGRRSCTKNINYSRFIDAEEEAAAQTAPKLPGNRKRALSDDEDFTPQESPKKLVETPQGLELSQPADSVLNDASQKTRAMPLITDLPDLQDDPPIRKTTPRKQGELIFVTENNQLPQPAKRVPARRTRKKAVSVPTTSTDTAITPEAKQTEGVIVAAPAKKRVRRATKDGNILTPQNKTTKSAKSIFLPSPPQFPMLSQILPPALSLNTPSLNHKHALIEQNRYENATPVLKLLLQMSTLQSISSTIDKLSTLDEKYFASIEQSAVPPSDPPSSMNIQSSSNHPPSQSTTTCILRKFTFPPQQQPISFDLTSETVNYSPRVDNEGLFSMYQSHPSTSVFPSSPDASKDDPLFIASNIPPSASKEDEVLSESTDEENIMVMNEPQKQEEQVSDTMNDSNNMDTFDGYSDLILSDCFFMSDHAQQHQLPIMPV